MSASIHDILRNDSKQLEKSLSIDAGSARIEVQCLLQYALQVDRAYLLSHPEQSLDADQHARYMAFLERRLGGEPIAYLLGFREFYGLNFKVSPATLIPRHETELLVDLALHRIPSPPSPLPLAGEGGRQAGRGKKFRVLDLGTGSGAIALSIAHARPYIEVVALDVSQDALEIARENLLRLNTNNVRLLRSDWFSALNGERFDLIVANPPYIAEADLHLTLGDLRFEPSAALASGKDGLDDIRRISTQAKAHLNRGGQLLFEHGYDQAEQVRMLLKQAGFSGVYSARDLSGVERVSGGI